MLSSDSARVADAGPGQNERPHPLMATPTQCAQNVLVDLSHRPGPSGSRHRAACDTNRRQCRYHPPPACAAWWKVGSDNAVAAGSASGLGELSCRATATGLGCSASSTSSTDTAIHGRIVWLVDAVIERPRRRTANQPMPHAGRQAVLFSELANGQSDSWVCGGPAHTQQSHSSVASRCVTSRHHASINTHLRRWVAVLINQEFQKKRVETEEPIHLNHDPESGAGDGSGERLFRRIWRDYPVRFSATPSFTGVFSWEISWNGFRENPRELGCFLRAFQGSENCSRK